MCLKVLLVAAAALLKIKYIIQYYIITVLCFHVCSTLQCMNIKVKNYVYLHIELFI